MCKTLFSNITFVYIVRKKKKKKKIIIQSSLFDGLHFTLYTTQWNEQNIRTADWLVL